MNGERRKILVDKTAEYVLKIVNHMYGAYRSLPASERPRIFPKVYIGTPHFDGRKWGEEAALLAMDGENQQARAIQDEFAALYRDTFAQIYQKITMQNQVISPSGNYYAPVNTEDIAGIYYGKEDPMFDIRVGDEQGFDTLDLIHRHSSKNHNTLDFNYDIGVDENHNRAYADFAGLQSVECTTHGG